MIVPSARILGLLALTLLVVALAPTLRAEREAAPAEWPDAALDAVARMPVQAEGRTKPLSTWAAYTLLRMNHRRTIETPDGSRRSATAWLLDAWLRPDAVRSYRMLLVADGAVLDAVGLGDKRRKKRDRYTLAELLPARERLQRLAHEYAAIDAKQRSPVQTGVVKLAHDVTQLEWLTSFLDFARRQLEVPDALRSRFDGQSRVPVSAVLRQAPDLLALAGHGEEGAAAARSLLQAAAAATASARALAIVPPLPDATDASRWLTPAVVAQAATSGARVPDGHLDVLAGLEALVAAEGASLGARAADLLQRTHDVEGDHVDISKLDLEVSLARLDPFFKSLWLFVLAFLLVAASWLKPNRWLIRAVWSLALAALALTVYGIVVRCVLRGRPPVSTLYETVLFITAFCVLAALVVERMNRQRIALALAPLLGALGLFLAQRYEVLKGEDTMPQLVAVLDTNFWLATHVTCITIGYATGLLAAALGHVYVLGQVFGLRRNDAAFYRSIGRMVYGMVCFGLIFGVVGTILGGIWANESWGRFWGWDPKENGALLIVLTELMILHARMGGYLKAYGIAMASIFLGGVVAFSWWGVNLLGIGLHSYGFTDGVMDGLRVFYAFELAVLMTGAAWWFQARRVATS
ncbi:MAG: cytochrome c biogenesis protein CcsA [Planctomycetota bacterium]|nr:cytochrome c biogenesis protein CcsA [Planctomycetota bacterium]